MNYNSYSHYFSRHFATQRKSSNVCSILSHTFHVFNHLHNAFFRAILWENTAIAKTINTVRNLQQFGAKCCLPRRRIIDNRIIKIRRIAMEIFHNYVQYKISELFGSIAFVFIALVIKYHWYFLKNANLQTKLFRVNLKMEFKWVYMELFHFLLSFI